MLYLIIYTIHSYTFDDQNNSNILGQINFQSKPYVMFLNFPQKWIWCHHNAYDSENDIVHSP